MNELSSTEFRKVYAKLKEPTLVTVNGHGIGRWYPGDPFAAETKLDVEALAATRPLITSATPQAQRDDLLRKINRR